MNFVFKDTPKKIMHPTDNPAWEKKKRIAAKRVRDGKLKFSNEAEERDYVKRVNSNPNNVYGLPAFYPSQTLTSSLIGVRPAIGCGCGGCCVSSQEYICPRCGKDNSLIEESQTLTSKEIS